MEPFNGEGYGSDYRMFSLPCLLQGKSIPVPPYSPTEQTVILVGSILQVFKGFMIRLECESFAS